MAKILRIQLGINDGNGNRVPIQTASWVSNWVNVEEFMRYNITVGIDSATGAPGDLGGFTGTFLVQGTDELAQCNGGTGTPDAGLSGQPGICGATGARYPMTMPTLGAISHGVQGVETKFSMSSSAVTTAFIRCTFNAATGTWVPTGSLGGSGTMNVFLTAKKT